MTVCVHRHRHISKDGIDGIREEIRKSGAHLHIMKFQYFTWTILVLSFAGCSQSASIADTVTVEEIHTPEGIVTVPENADVVETEPIAEEVIRLEVEEPKMIHADDIPYEVSSVHDEDVVPVVAGDENCEKPHDDVVEEQIIERAERQADEDLLKALDTVLTKKETIEDVIRTEEVTIPQV